MITSGLYDQFWRDGYLHLPQFFDSRLMDILDLLITDHFGVDPDWFHDPDFLKKSATEVVPWFPQMQGIAAFDLIDEVDDFNSLTELLIGQDWQNLYSMVMFSKKGTSGQAWHQDCPPEDSSLHNLNRLIYTSDIVPEIGGEVCVMPKSHKMGVLPIGEPHEDMDGQMILRPKKGDLLMLHGHTWHRVLPIRDKFRHSVNYRAAPIGTPKDVTDICVYRNMRYSFNAGEVIEQRM